MKTKPFSTILGLIAGIGFVSQVHAATVVATPNSGVAPGNVTIDMIFGANEAPQAFQLSVNLVDSLGNATTGAGVFTVTLVSPTLGGLLLRPTSTQAREPGICSARAPTSPQSP